jgi:hypothetical protein
MSNNSVSYRNSHYLPCKEISAFIRFLSESYYGEKCQTVLAQVRQVINEFTNDPSIKMSLGLSVNPDTVSGQSELYNLSSLATQEKICSIGIFPDPLLNLDPAILKLVNTFPVINDFKELTYGADSELPVQFTSVYHQLRTITSFLSDKCILRYTHNEDKSRYYLYLTPRDINEYKFQVAIILLVPKAVPKVQAA